MPAPKEDRVMRKTLMLVVRLLVALLLGRDARADTLSVRIGGRSHWLYRDGVLLPAMAGGDGSDDDDDGVDDDEGDEEEEEDEDPDEEGFDEAAKEALRKERKARREAEKARKTAEKEAAEKAKRLKEIEDSDASELERAQAKLAEHEEREAKSTEKLRRANLVAELSKPKYELSNASAAAKLIEGIEFNDDDEPEDVEDAVKALLEEVPGLKAGEPPKGGSKANPRKGKSMTREEVQRLAREDPDRFNAMYEKGEIPATALGG